MSRLLVHDHHTLSGSDQGDPLIGSDLMSSVIKVPNAVSSVQWLKTIVCALQSPIGQETVENCQGPSGDEWLGRRLGGWRHLRGGWGGSI